MSQSPSLSLAASQAFDMMDSLGLDGQAAPLKSVSRKKAIVRQKKEPAARKGVASQFAIDVVTAPRTSDMFQHSVFCVLESSDFTLPTLPTTSSSSSTLLAARNETKGTRNFTREGVI